MRKRLIEYNLPLADISAESAREKNYPPRSPFDPAHLVGAATVGLFAGYGLCRPD